MDKKQLKEILKDIKTPDADDNARKRAVNLAMAEFETRQKEKQKKSQGLPFFARLMGKSTDEQRRTPMEEKSRKKLVYGGMATAMAVVLIAGVSFTQLQDFGSDRKAGTSSALQHVTFDTDGSGTAMRSAPPASYREAIPEEAEMRMEEAYNASPMPAAPAKEEARIARSKMALQKTAPMAQMGAADIAAPPPVIMNDEMAPQEYKDVGRDQFEDFEVNPFKIVSEEPVSTFSADVDTASYSFIRRQLNHGALPQKDAVRIEEMVNYFDYNYPLPETREQPFKPTVTIVPSPWAEGKQLMHIGIKGFDIETEKPRSNLVFLLDVSGSMSAQDKLPLVKQSMKMLLDSLNPDDTIAIAVYAGAAGTVLEPTKASERSKIYAALDRLNAGGSTAGAAGINLAYQLAEQNFDENAVNRVILATDGDFNVGITNREELKDFVERKRNSGIFLSVLGFGQGNLNDHTMQTLAQNGNGVAAYIDNVNEARKVLIEEANSTLFPIAKDVKMQVEFNPQKVAEYRLIGYETRHLNREDFNNDKVDAGDIGAGHSITAIYEITPAGSEATSVDELRYAAAESAEKTKSQSDFNEEYAFLKIRYKLPKEDTSKLITTPVTTQNALSWDSASDDTRFATAVAGFGQLLKGGKYTANFSYDDVIETAQNAKGEDPFGYRAEFINLVRLAKTADAMQLR